METPAASCVPNLPVPTYMQSCVVNVSPNGSVQNVNPCSKMIPTCATTVETYYDAPFASVSPWFDSIANLLQGAFFYASNSPY